MGPFRHPARFLVALGCLSLLGSACRNAGDDIGSSDDSDAGNARFALAASLRGFDACDDLLAHLKKVGVERVTPYGLEGLGVYPQPMMAEAARAADASVNAGAVPTATSAGSGTAYSTTNTVEAGIDEGDLVKTDGTHLFVLAGGRLHIVAAGPTPKVVGSLDLPGAATQLVRVGTTLLIAGQPQATTNDDGPTLGDQPAVQPWYDNRSVLWQVDIADPAAPVLQRQLVVEGSVLSIRMTGDVARVVVRTTPPGLDFVAPTRPGSEARALRTNKEVIADSALEDWLGRFRLLDGDGQTVDDGPMADCRSVSVPPTFRGFTSTTLLSVNVAERLGAPNGVTILADSQQVYASPANLYVAIGVWQDSASPAPEAGAPNSPERSPTEVTTSIHRFTFDGDRAAYTATGSVGGSLMNDFSMSERDAVLRVATTTGAPWGWTDESSSSVTTLEASGNELVTVGKVGDLGRGERIYGVRFVGTNAYLVTFRQTDPLYVVDLRDPKAPAVSGALKMNGYSGYLHPIGEDRLLGVGRDAEDTGRTTGALVATFDVSDPTRPTRTVVYTLPAAWLNTEWDHQSFLWWEPEALALMTATFGSPDGAMAIGGVLGLDIGKTSITERGRILPSGPDVTCANPSGVIVPTIPPGAVSSAGSSGTAATGTASSAGAVSSARAVGSAVAVAPAIATPAPAGPETAGTKPAIDALPPVCWGYVPPITRTVVVGDTVFSVSDTAVQANTLRTLADTGRVELR